MLRRLLERPCTLALLVGSQLAVMMYLSLGGFRNLSALFARDQGPTFDYSHPHDVYSNLSQLSGSPLVSRDPPAFEGLPNCPERSPLLGECRGWTEEVGTGLEPKLVPPDFQALLFLAGGSAPEGRCHTTGAGRKGWGDRTVGRVLALYS